MRRPITSRPTKRTTDAVDAVVAALVADRVYEERHGAQRQLIITLEAVASHAIEDHREAEARCRALEEVVRRLQDDVADLASELAGCRAGNNLAGSAGQDE